MGQQNPCPSCNTVNNLGARFCANCGTPLGGMSTPTGPSTYTPLPPSAAGSQNPYASSGYPYPSTSYPPYPPFDPYPVAPPPPQHTVPSPEPSPRRISRRRLLFGLGGAAVVAAAAGGAGWYFLSQKGNTPPAPGGKTSINFYYSTEKKDWIVAATQAFSQSPNGQNIQVNLYGRGSVDTLNGILKGTLNPPPTVWSPASFLELSQLRVAWEPLHPNQDVITTDGNLTPQPLVHSPLVFAVWKDRADVLMNHYGRIDWPSIHDASKKGWAAIGGQSAWQQVKFGQTRPDGSNSGLLTIVLIAYDHYMKQRGLTVANVQDQGFLSYLNDFETAVNTFGASSGTFLQQHVIPLGPPQYDLVTTYENLVLANQQSAVHDQGQVLEPFYPSTNIESQHPFAILSNASPGQQMAAQQFRDFLLDVPAQQLALNSGFRPTNLNVQINQTIPNINNMFLTQGQDITRLIPQGIQSVAQAPDGDVIGELIRQWRARYKNASTWPS